MFKPWRTFLLLLLLIVLVLVVYANQRGIVHLLGIDTQQSDNYDFVSGVGPMIITAVGYGGMIAGLWHHVNCHSVGCWRIGRHKVDGTPWCNRHHLNARAVAIASLNDVIAKLDELITVSSSLTDVMLTEMRHNRLPDESHE